jgi:SAM-dependent methyltransferase
MNAVKSWKPEFERQFYVDPSQTNELLLGCGAFKEKRIVVPGKPKDWTNLVTLDMNPDVSPTVEWDLNNLPLPFADEVFDEIHAYEVLEHTGQQGDFRFFLEQFSDFWRILKPGGFLLATVPMWDSPWAWGDPSHTRVITKGTLVFLSQQEYINQIDSPKDGKRTSMTDFRRWYQADFDCVAGSEGEHQLNFVLQAVKPSRAHGHLNPS